MSENPIKREVAVIGKKKSFSFFRVILHLIELIIIACIWIIASKQTVKYYDIASDYLTTQYKIAKSDLYSFLNVVERTQAIQIDESSYDSVRIGELVRQKSEKYGINPAILLATADQESGFDPTRIRFEQSWKDQYKKLWKQGKLTDIEYDLLFSSIGLMQIGYGLHRDTCEIKHFTELLDPDKNLDCAAKLYRNCFNRNSDLKPAARVRTCVKEFNGSGPRAEKYRDIVMEKIDDYLIENSKEKLFVDVKREFARLNKEDKKDS